MDYVNTGAVATQTASSRKTVVDWIMEGVDVHGRRVKLQAVRIGGRWKVRPEWIEAFIAACNDGSSSPVNPAKESRQGKKDQARVRELLA